MDDDFVAGKVQNKLVKHYLVEEITRLQTCNTVIRHKQDTLNPFLFDNRDILLFCKNSQNNVELGQTASSKSTKPNLVILNSYTIKYSSICCNLHRVLLKQTIFGSASENYSLNEQSGNVASNFAFTISMFGWTLSLYHNLCMLRSLILLQASTSQQFKPAMSTFPQRIRPAQIRTISDWFKLFQLLSRSLNNLS